MTKNVKIESPNELLELAIGYQKSQVLFSFVELEIPKILGEKNLRAKELAEKIGIEPIAMEKFLNTCVVVGLLKRKSGVCIISGWILEKSLLAPETAVLFCLEDINWQSTDVERSFEVYESWLAEAGFTGIEHKTYLSPTSIVYGFKNE